MDAVTRKAHRQIDATASKASSKGSARKGKKKKRSPKTQNAGQPSGPSARSRVAPDNGEETEIVEGESTSGTKCASYVVGAVHAIDVGLGLALLVYGAMVHVPQVTAASVAYGLILSLGAVAGALGYYSEACNRKGLLASAIAAGLEAILDIFLFIAVIAGWDSFIKFLNENMEGLLLNDDSVKSIQNLKYLFVVVFFVLAGLEAYRCIAMIDMDKTSQGSSSRSSSQSKCDWLLSLLGLSKRKKTDDMVVFDDSGSMESALLWSKDGSQPTSDDYLEFVPEHERRVANNFASSVALPKPPEDQDY